MAADIYGVKSPNICPFSLVPLGKGKNEAMVGGKPRNKIA